MPTPRDQAAIEEVLVPPADERHAQFDFALEWHPPDRHEWSSEPSATGFPAEHRHEIPDLLQTSFLKAASQFHGQQLALASLVPIRHLFNIVATCSPAIDEATLTDVFYEIIARLAFRLASNRWPVSEVLKLQGVSIFGHLGPTDIVAFTRERFDRASSLLQPDDADSPPSVSESQSTRNQEAEESMHIDQLPRHERYFHGLSEIERTALQEIRAVKGTGRSKRARAKVQEVMRALSRQMKHHGMLVSQPLVHLLKHELDQRDMAVRCPTCGEPASLRWLTNRRCSAGGVVTCFHVKGGEEHNHTARTRLPEYTIAHLSRRRQ